MQPQDYRRDIKHLNIFGKLFLVRRVGYRGRLDVLKPTSNFVEKNNFCPGDLNQGSEPKPTSKYVLYPTLGRWIDIFIIFYQTSPFGRKEPTKKKQPTVAFTFLKTGLING